MAVGLGGAVGCAQLLQASHPWPGPTQPQGPCLCLDPTLCLPAQPIFFPGAVTLPPRVLACPVDLSPAPPSLGTTGMRPVSNPQQKADGPPDVEPACGASLRFWVFVA